MTKEELEIENEKLKNKLRYEERKLDNLRTAFKQLSGIWLKMCEHKYLIIKYIDDNIPELKKLGDWGSMKEGTRCFGAIKELKKLREYIVNLDEEE